MSGRRPLSLALTLPPSYSNNIVSEELCLILSIRLYNHIPYCFSGSSCHQEDSALGRIKY